MELAIQNGLLLSTAPVEGSCRRIFLERFPSSPTPLSPSLKSSAVALALLSDYNNTLECEGVSLLGRLCTVAEAATAFCDFGAPRKRDR